MRVIFSKEARLAPTANRHLAYGECALAFHCIAAEKCREKNLTVHFLRGIITVSSCFTEDRNV